MRLVYNLPTRLFLELLTSYNVTNIETLSPCTSRRSTRGDNGGVVPRAPHSGGEHCGPSELVVELHCADVLSSLYYRRVCMLWLVGDFEAYALRWCLIV